MLPLVKSLRPFPSPCGWEEEESATIPFSTFFCHRGPQPEHANAGTHFHCETKTSEQSHVQGSCHTPGSLGRWSCLLQRISFTTKASFLGPCPRKTPPVAASFLFSTFTRNWLLPIAATLLPGAPGRGPRNRVNGGLLVSPSFLRGCGA